ncbi:MAG: hypothetical protein LBP62_01030 [Clostridiales bacterium]|jgi:hypothetical protein|nr:hypothetical protein [Clostridiales bacterium]
MKKQNKTLLKIFIMVLITISVAVFASCENKKVASSNTGDSSDINSDTGEIKDNSGYDPNSLNNKGVILLPDLL